MLGTIGSVQPELRARIGINAYGAGRRAFLCSNATRRRASTERLCSASHVLARCFVISPKGRCQLQAEIQTAELWDGVEEPGEPSKWERRYPPRGAALRLQQLLDEVSGVGPQRRAWACYGKLEPYGA